MAKVDPAYLGKLRGRVLTLCEREGIPAPYLHAEVSPGRERTSGNTKILSWDGDRPETGKITLMLGYDEADADVVLQHEVAHWAAAHVYGKKVHHDRRFWRIAWRIFMNEGIKEPQIRRELAYKEAAIEVAYEVGISPELIELVQTDRQERREAVARELPPGTREVAVIGPRGERIEPGDTVQFDTHVRPQYLISVRGTFKGVAGQYPVVDIGARIGRFGPMVRCRPLQFGKVD